MYSKTISFFALAAATLLAAACGKEEPEPAAPLPRLLSVSVTETELVLLEKGTASLSFRVEEPDYALQEGLVRLSAKDGIQVSEFRISRIVAGEGKGTYTAVIEDLGVSVDYSREVRLLIGNSMSPGTYVPSGYFTVRSEGAGYGVLVKTGLPTVYVDTENAKPVESKETYVKATMKIRGAGEWEGLTETGCEIRGRGNTTWYWPKKPYLLKLDEKQHIFGMHKHKRWVLLANFMDRTLMRNLVSMKVASMTKLGWTPGCVPVELVLNGRHMGSYLLIEQVRVDNHRVAITEMTPEDNAGDAVTGGYLLELDFHYDNPVQWTDPHGYNHQWGNGIPFGVKYPDSEDITPQQLAYVKNYVAEAANTLYGNDFLNPKTGYAKYIDVDSFIDYWIVFEVMGNHELGNPGSVFMHKDRGGKLVAGPCWDFDWGVLSYNTSPQARTGLINRKAIWYERLMQDPAFKARLKARFEELLPQLETIPDYMDECEKLLTASATLNFRMWNPAEDASQNGGYIINGDENMTFHDAVARLKTIYKERLKVIPKNL
ncbi:MAG: CotH kinase family protein [Bacteroidales bacterium]|nr:CotH kinase family protein [Bacteroidales bacterium]